MLLKRLLFAVLIFAFPLLVLGQTSIGPGAKLQWDPPTDLSDIAEYWIYFYPVSGGYDLSGPPTAKVSVTEKEWVIDPGIMEEVPYFGIATSADAAGNQSGPSNEIDFEWDSTPPTSPPTNFRFVMKQVAYLDPETGGVVIDPETGKPKTVWALVMEPDPK